MNYSRSRMLYANVTALPSSIGKLKHLRQLNLSNSPIRTLPDTICGLWNLQIMNLNYCDQLVRLPKNLRYLYSLRHLFLESCRALNEMAPKIGEITSLKTLSLFIVGHKIGNQLSELECLNIGGKLEIRHLGRVKNHLDTRKAKLVEKPNLRRLVLKGGGGNGSESQEMIDEMVLQALEPHPNIDSLWICGFKGKSFPVWMKTSTMANVIRIDISECPNCLCLPPLGDLPLLKQVRLIDLGIEYIMEDEVQGVNPIMIKFRSLKELELSDLPNLKGLLKEEVREIFPNLQKLIIRYCSLLRLPPLSSLKELDIFGCSQLNLSSLSGFDNLTSLKLSMDEDTTFTETLESRSNLTTLEDLYIRYCKDLVELPEGVKYLHSLISLRLQYLPKLVCLPEGLQHVHSLQRLRLCELDQLTSLPD